MVKKYLPLLRVSHYLKNFYIFLPLFFSGEILISEKLFKSLPVFFSFCLVASSIYIFNDLMDIEFDLKHPIKKNRPIPSGMISKFEAYFLTFILFFTAVAIAYTVSSKVLIVIIGYFLLNILYSVKLKNFALIDVTIVSIGFNLRVIAGGLATGIIISKWLMVMVFLLSMFQALSKRMDDLYLMAKDSNSQLRRSIHGYNIEFLQIVLSMLTGVLLVCYIMYIISPEIIFRLGEYSYFTTVFVLLGLLRYLQFTFVKKASGSPVKILSNDKFIQLCILFWLITFATLIYLK
ncbi:UbiA prenyltransferase family protein [Mucilaginibacter arboris]|uniref:Prenyltransferase n=1 Tax=Mucilaginibacter arboris TaxID=2682090 RepID=A0A7K1SXW9_9SPHI|nr:UbiA prenyltransferase family protein [Mucilaginibacter arboris]MVN21860.1 prenyltransferase [Mucilaginibacter arboris]